MCLVDEKSIERSASIVHFMDKHTTSAEFLSQLSTKNAGKRSHMQSFKSNRSQKCLEMLLQGIFLELSSQFEGGVAVFLGGVALFHVQL